MHEEYSVVYSRRKTLGLEVTPDGRAVVRAPFGAPKKVIEAFVKKHEAWLRDRLRRRLQWLESHPEPTPEEIARLKKQAREYLMEATAYYGQKMGLYPESVKITSARTRFGSCSGENRICYSWRVMLYPKEAVDYVVVHELAHIRHKNHGPEFYALVASVLPDHEARRRMLRGME